jgi:hypothetical protein
MIHCNRVCSPVYSTHLEDVTHIEIHLKDKIKIRMLSYSCFIWQQTKRTLPRKWVVSIYGMKLNPVDYM